MPGARKTSAPSRNLLATLWKCSVSSPPSAMRWYGAGAISRMVQIMVDSRLPK